LKLITTAGDIHCWRVIIDFAWVTRLNYCGCHPLNAVDLAGLHFFISYFYRLKEPIIKNTPISIGQKNGLHAFGYNSAESEPIWMKSGKVWAKCWGLILADFGHDSRSRDSFLFGPVNESLSLKCTLHTRKVLTQIFRNVWCPILRIKTNSTLQCWCGLVSDILK